MNYLSWWIANLGVVPLFWFWAFLLLPIFTFLLARRLRVTLVLETIIFSLTYLQFRQMNLTNLANYVKVLMLLFIIIQSAITVASDIGQETIYIGKGQLLEIKEQNIRHFTIGNSEVIKAKIHKNDSLLIKGNKIGHSEMLIWHQNKKAPKKLTFNIISKTKKMRLQQIEKSITELKLKVRYHANYYEVSGQLNKLESYRTLKRVISNSKEDIRFDQVFPTHQLQRELLTEIYDIALRNQLDQLDCHFKTLTLNCHYDYSNKLPQEIQKLLKNNFFISLVPIDLHRNRFFRAKIQILQFEHFDGEDFHLGLDKLEGHLSHLFTDGINSLVRNNPLLINNKDINISTIARPQTVIRFNHPAIIKIGSDIPFTVSGNQGVSHTQWKFAGLDIDLNIKPMGDYILASYKTKFTGPSENNAISGSQESSSAYLSPGRVLKLFDITYQSIGKENSSFPYLSLIPILGKLFISKSNRSSYKKVVGYLLLEEIEL